MDYVGAGFKILQGEYISNLEELRNAWNDQFETKGDGGFSDPSSICLSFILDAENKINNGSSEETVYNIFIDIQDIRRRGRELSEQMLNSF